MPALNFQARFVPAIENGLAELSTSDCPPCWCPGARPKRQTIRAERRDGRRPAKIGDTLYLYTGMRTKRCRKLGEARARVVMPFKLTYRNGLNVNLVCGDPGERGGESRFRVASLVGRTRGRFRRIALADGFDSPEEMVDFFEHVHGLPFQGWLIRW